jgi:hypothetical protein
MFTSISREADILGYTRRNKTKQKHSTMHVGHHYAQTHTHTINVNKTCALGNSQSLRCYNVH